MSKRKAEGELEDQKNGKLQKTDGKETKEEKVGNKEETRKENKDAMSLDTENKCVVNPGSPFINFTDMATRKKYHPDTKLISDVDGTVLHYHICKLVDIPYFDKIYNGNFENAKSKEVRFNFSGRVINYFLNWTEGVDKFLKNFSKEKILYEDMFELTNMADFIKHDTFTIDFITILLRYNTFNDKIDFLVLNNLEKNRNKLWEEVIEGKKKIQNDTSSELISMICNHALDNKMYYQAMQNLIPYFIPEQKQIDRFDLMISVRIPNPSQAFDRELAFRTVKKVRKDLIEEFINKHVGNKGADMLIKHITKTLLQHSHHLSPDDVVV